MAPGATERIQSRSVVSDPAVDAGVTRLGAADAVARVADQPHVGARWDQQRAAGVALAGVHAALRVAGCDLRLALEAAEQRVDAVDEVRIGLGSHLVVDDRHARLLEDLRLIAARLGHTKSGDGRQGPGRPEGPLFGRSDVAIPAVGVAADDVSVCNEAENSPRGGYVVTDGPIDPVPPAFLRGSQMHVGNGDGNGLENAAEHSPASRLCGPDEAGGGCTDPA